MIFSHFTHNDLKTLRGVNRGLYDFVQPILYKTSKFKITINKMSENEFYNTRLLSSIRYLPTTTLYLKNCYDHPINKELQNNIISILNKLEYVTSITFDNGFPNVLEILPKIMHIMEKVILHVNKDFEPEKINYERSIIAFNKCVKQIDTTRRSNIKTLFINFFNNTKYTNYILTSKIAHQYFKILGQSLESLQICISTNVAIMDFFHFCEFKNLTRLHIHLEHKSLDTSYVGIRLLYYISGSTKFKGYNSYFPSQLKHLHFKDSGSSLVVNSINLKPLKNLEVNKTIFN